ncbi:MAG: alpha-L-fucosidase [Lentisphaeria bacterium]|nr:alpha-L-fucosidase [Lentisphaeria bacterium]
MIPENHKWFREAKLGLFVHWGLYSVLGRGEWAMYMERYPKEKYAELMKQFNPQNFNMDSLCSFAKACGMKYMVFTTCHHEGFAMFDSKADPFNSMNSPAHRDFVAEYVESCRRHGLKVGLYYSLGDWRFGYPKISDSQEQADKMRELTFAQVRELMTNYGKIDILWYDGGWCYPSLFTDGVAEVARFWHAEELNAMVRSLQPDILINNRSGLPEDFSTPEGVSGKGADKLCEACFTLGGNANSHWGYFKNEVYKKNEYELINLLVTALYQETNLLLNVGPDENGVIPAWQKELIEKIGAWVNRYPEAVYNVHYEPDVLTVTHSNGNQFCKLAGTPEAYYGYLINYPGENLFIPAVKKEIESVQLLGSDAKITFKQERGGIQLNGLPEEPVDPLCCVLKLNLKTKGI